MRRHYSKERQYESADFLEEMSVAEVNLKAIGVSVEKEIILAEYDKLYQMK